MNSLYQDSIRFIPTPVGNTSRVQGIYCGATVHPHACGEHIIDWSRPCPSIGSSPRLWGTHDAYPESPNVRRFIPTPVGNTPPGCIPPEYRTVHPHACGEHWLRICARFCAIGSSPRLWGTLPLAFIVAAQPRFIPTPVGNTFPRINKYWLFPVHPHACGEHIICQEFDGRNRGSSPRLWGTRLPPTMRHSSRRFIPTPVGNTWRMATS